MQIIRADCLMHMPTLPAASIDAVVTDPPYGLEFMGKDWDGAAGFRRALNQADTGRDSAFGRMSARAPEYRAGHLFQQWTENWARECLRVLKPGGHIIAFGGSRTYHRLACAIEDAGFEIRDQLQWLYGQGMPKHKSVLKPAHEPIVLARKPLIGTIGVNVAKFGTGALNIDKCRIDFISASDMAAAAAAKRAGADQNAGRNVFGQFNNGASTIAPYLEKISAGRWPANVMHDGSPAVLDLFPESAGQLADLKIDGSLQRRNVYGGAAIRRAPIEASADRIYADAGSTTFSMKPGARRKDSGSAARFFYCGKATKAERAGSKHPTVKPIALMRWLCRLVTPVNGLILDPFAGSGTTGLAARAEGFHCILIEQSAEYIADIERRIGAL